MLVSPTGTEAPLPVAADVIVLDRDFQSHDPVSLVKSCESLTFLIRDVTHVTPYNFEMCVCCARTFAEAVLCSFNKRARIHNVVVEEPILSNYQQVPIHLLELMHTLHTKTAKVFEWWAEEIENSFSSSLWHQAWRPLLQGIARLCCDSRRPVRTAAITYLQSTLLTHDLDKLSDVEWSQCLEQVLFPLLVHLLGPISTNDPIGVEETRIRAAMLLSKVFLHHLKPLERLPGFLPLWLTVLDLLRAYMHADKSELLLEAIPESLKNMLLVMASSEVLKPDSHLWAPTWRAIDGFLPDLKSELFPQLEPSIQTPRTYFPQVISLADQQHSSFPQSVSPNSYDDAFVVSSSTPCLPPIIIGKCQRDVNFVSSRVKMSIANNNSSHDYSNQHHMITSESQQAPSISCPVAIQSAAQSSLSPHEVVAVQVTSDHKEYLTGTQVSPRHREHCKDYQNSELTVISATCVNETEVCLFNF